MESDRHNYHNHNWCHKCNSSVKLRNYRDIEEEARNSTLLGGGQLERPVMPG